MRCLLYLAFVAAALAQTAQPQAGQRGSDVGVAKSGPERMIIGFNQPFTYQINIANAGPEDASNVVMTDLVPPQFTVGAVVPSYSNGTVSCRPTINNLVNCTIVTLRVGDVARVLVNVTLPSNALPFDANNTACVTSSTFDPDLGNQCNSRVNPVVVSADLSITIQGPSGGIAGQRDNITEIVRVINLGFSDARDVVSRYKVTSPLLFQGVTILSGSGTCLFDIFTSEVVCTFGTVASGASFSYSVAQSIPAGALLPSGGDIIVWASVNSSTFDPNYLNNNDTHTITVTVASDVSVTKGSIPQVVAGQPDLVLFTIVLENAGPSNAAGVVMSDEIPSAFILRSATIQCNVTPQTRRNKRFTKADLPALVLREGPPCSHNLSCTVNNNFLQCFSSGLNLVERIVILVTVSVPESTPAQNVTNIAYVRTLTNDPDQERNSDPADVEIVRRVDLGVVKTGFAGSIISGDQNTYLYTITTTNNGPSIATDVTLRDTVPAPLVVTADPTIVLGTGSCTRVNNAVNCNFGTLAVGAQVRITIPFRVPANAATLGSINNTACIFTPNGDSDPSNNCSSWLNLVLAAPDVNVTKVGPGSIIIGSTQTYYYTITVNNNGPSDALNGVLRDIVPFPFVVSGPVSTSQGTCFVNVTDVNNIVCDLGALPFPSTVVILVPFTVPVGTTAPFASNTAYVFTTTPDRNPSNNNATFETVLIRRADLRVTKSGPAQLCAGEAAGTYSILIENLGPSDAVAVTLTDDLPSQLVPGPSSSFRFIGNNTAATCAFVGQRLSCSLGNLASLANIQVFYTASVAASTPGGQTVTNIATVAASTPDPNTANNVSPFNTFICANADVAIVKAGPATATAGTGIYTYTLNVRNNGPADAVNVLVWDPIPLDFTPQQPITFTADGSCAYVVAGGQTWVNCTFARLVPGAERVISFPFTVAATVTSGVRTNCASVASSVNDPNTSNNRFCVDTLVGLSADLQILKSGPGTICAGDLANAFFTVTVRNNGPSVATNVQVSDLLNSIFTPSSATLITPSGLCTYSGQQLSCSLGSLSVGQSVTIQYPVRVFSNVPAQFNVPNTAFVTGSISDPISANNNSTAFTNICATADIAVIKTGPATATAGVGTYTYQLQVSNLGNSNAVNVAIDDEVPIVFSVVGTPTATNGGVCTLLAAPQTYRCSWPQVFVPNQSEFVTITFTIPSTVTAATYTNCANASSTVTDPNLTNNRNCVQTAVNVQADLVVVKTGPIAICAGTGSGTYTIRVVNNGPAVAIGARLNDTVDSRFNIVPGSLTPSSSCAFAGQVLTCNFGSMSVGQVIIVTYSATVSASVAPANDVPNTAFVTSLTPDNTPNDDQSTHFTDICAQADVAVTKTAPPTAVAGNGVTYLYSITVQNNGPADATTVRITDPLPLQFTYGAQESIVATGGGSCSLTGTTPVTLSCVWPRIVVGQSFFVTLPFTVGSGVSAGSVQNCVSVTSAPGDFNATNDVACATTMISVLADVAITKNGPSNACAGDLTTYFYTVTIRNNGPSFAQNVQIADTIPSTLTPLSSPQVAVTGLPATCTYIAGTLNCNVGQVRVGEQVTVVFPFSVGNFVQATSVTNTAIVSTTTTESTTTNNQASFTTAICANADLSIVKSGPVSVVAGETALQQFTLVVRNNGPAVSYNVTVTDNNILQAFFNVQSVTTLSGVQCAINRNQGNTVASISCFYPQMNIGQTDTITINFFVPSGAAAGIQQNCAAIASTVTNDPNLANNQFCINVLIVAQADLRTTKTGPAFVTAGVNGPLNTYVVVVQNIGGSDAVQSTLVDTVPADFRLASVSTTIGTCTFGADNVVRCSFGTLLPQQFATVTYTFTVAGDITSQPRQNLACANTTTLESRYDNNCAVVVTQVLCSAVNSISKTDNVVQVIAGNTTVQTFTIVIRNNGPSSSRDTVVTDTFPAEYTRVNGPSPSQGTCSLAGTGFVCNLGTIPVNGSATIFVSYTVAANVVATSATNTACVANSCAPQASICAVDTNTILRLADLFVVKDDCVSTVLAGSQTATIFTITATNQGPSDALNFVLRDTWPAQYIQGAITTSPAGAQCTITGRDFICRWANLPAGATAVVTVAYTVDSTTPSQYVTNCVVVSSDTSDNNNVNNEDCDTNLIRVEADLEVTKKIDNNDCVVAGSGDPRAYTVVVTNKGPSTALNVVVFDRFPVDLVASGPSICTNVGPNYTCALGNLPLGASATLVWRFIVDASRVPGLVENHVSVTSPTFDPELCNNNATVCSIICAESDLAVTKTDNQIQVTAGDLVTYTYTIVGTNYGPSWARNVTFSDVWPREFTRGNVSAPGGVVTYTTDGFQVVYPLLRVGESYVIRVSYTVDACVLACDACNFVSISSPYEDPNETNNNAKDCTLIRTEADLEVCKSDNVSVVTAGDGVVYQYTIKVGNNGPSCAQKVQLVDHFPSQVLQIPGTLTTSQGSCTFVNNGTDFSCNLLTLRPGQTVTLYVNYTVPASANTCSVCNLVTVSSLTFDPELCNNDAKDCNSLVEKARVTITKTDGLTTIAGNDLTPRTYTITVGNAGPSTARDVVVTDRWPAQFTQFLQSLTTSRGRCVGVGRDFTCSVGDLAVGQTAVILVSYSNMQPPMCGQVSNWASAFSPTDEECRFAWDNNTVVCSPIIPTEPCVNCAIAAVEVPSGFCYNYHQTICRQNADCASCYESIKQNPASPSPTCYSDPTACQLFACIYNGPCRGPPGQGGPCNSPEQVTVTCPTTPAVPANPIGPVGPADLSFFFSGATQVCRTSTSQYIATIFNDNNLNNVSNTLNAENVRLNITLPAAVVPTSVSANGGLNPVCTITGQVVACSLGHLAVRPARLQVTINFNVAAGVAAGTTITPTAFVTANNAVNVANDIFVGSQTIVNCNTQRSSFAPINMNDATPVMRTEAAEHSYEPRAAKGKLLSAKLMEVSVESTGPRSFKASMKNTMQRALTLEGVSVQVTGRNGKIASADLSKASALVTKTACDKVLGTELHEGWVSSCEFTIAEEASAVKVSARGTQNVRGGFHPVMGSAHKALKN